MIKNKSLSFKKIVFRLFVFLFVVGMLPSITNIQNVSAKPDEAAKCDEAFYSSNDILFYNPCETTCSTSAGSGGAGKIDKLRGNNNGEKIFNYWLDASMTSQQAAGITGSIQHESGFSPFRQEMSQSWPGGGWGIAQFTHSPGQRQYATEYVRNDIGAALFDQYYLDKYGGSVSEGNGFIPEGVPLEVNDKFLLSELNYLLQHIKELKPNNVRRDDYQADFNQTVSAEITLYDYLKSVVKAGDAATAWTYLYEYPGDIKNTAIGRADSANTILELYGNGISTNCGGNLKSGGMNLEEAIKFMEDYKNGKDSQSFLGGADQSCVGGPFANCVSFSAYFINKYTNINGFVDQSPGNGSGVVGNIVSRNPSIKNGHSPQPYAIFSNAISNMMCGDTRCGHTGVVLGVDTTRGKVIVGEAGCGSALSWTTAREYELAEWDSDAYTYAYTDGLLKGDVK